MTGSSWPWSYGNWIYKYICNQCLSPLMFCVRLPLMARCTTLCDKVCRSLATGRWFPPGPPVPSTNTNDRHDITEILLKVVLNTIKLILTPTKMTITNYSYFIISNLLTKLTADNNSNNVLTNPTPRWHISCCKTMFYLPTSTRNTPYP